MNSITKSKILTQSHWRIPWVGRISALEVREYAPTFATEFAVLLSQMLAYKLVAHYLGKNGFSEYAIVRRLVSLISPVPLLGIGIGLPRYIGYANGSGDSGAAARYSAAGLCCVAAATLICVLIMNLGSHHFAYLFFGNSSYAHFVFPLSAMVVGLGLHTLACGHFRGLMAMNRANLLQFINLAVMPLLVFGFVHNDLNRILLVLGGLWTLIAVAAMLPSVLRIRTFDVFPEAKTLLRYGVQRVPGDFMLMVLFTLPVTVSAHFEGVQQAGYVAFAIAVLSMIGAIFAPVGLVLLPKATYMFAEGSHRELRLHVLTILKGSVIVCAVVAVLVSVFANQLIGLYFGHGYERVAILVRLMVFGALPYSLYLVLRNIIDAFHKNGVTALILLVSLAVAAVGVTLGVYADARGQGCVPAFLFSLLVLAIASSWECKRILSDQT